MTTPRLALVAFAMPSSYHPSHQKAAETVSAGDVSGGCQQRECRRHSSRRDPVGLLIVSTAPLDRCRTAAAASPVFPTCRATFAPGSSTQPSEQRTVFLVLFAVSKIV